MNHKDFFKYMLSFLFVGILVVSAIFLPQFYSGIQDRKYQDTVTLFSRDQQLASHDYETSFDKKLDILTQSESTGKALPVVLQTRQNVVSTETLTEKLTQELTRLKDNSLFIKILPIASEQSNLKTTRLYSVQNEQDKTGTSGSVLFWYMEFKDKKNSSVRLCVDAYTYTVYYASFQDNDNSARTNGASSDGDALTDTNMVDPNTMLTLDTYADYLKVDVLGISRSGALLIEDVSVDSARFSIIYSTNALDPDLEEIGLGTIISWLSQLD